MLGLVIGARHEYQKHGSKSARRMGDPDCEHRGGCQETMTRSIKPTLVHAAQESWQSSLWTGPCFSDKKILVKGGVFGRE
jgi:hypothetical protein